MPTKNTIEAIDASALGVVYILAVFAFMELLGQASAEDRLLPVPFFLIGAVICFGYFLRCALRLAKLALTSVVDSLTEPPPRKTEETYWGIRL